MNQETNLDKALEAIRNGEFVLVFDDDDREGEVDMIIASEFVTPKSIATMRNDAGPELAKLAPTDIPYDERSSFSVWTNHRKSFTGVTDHDRAMTISEMAIMMKEERFDEFGATFRSPGHVCLLRGADGLVKNRQGHTEIGLALCEMAGVTPVCVVCEMMDGETGQATSVADARKYAEENGLVLLRGEDIINKYLEE